MRAHTPGPGVLVRPALDHELDAAGAVVALAYASDDLAVGDYLDELRERSPYAGRAGQTLRSSA